MTEPAKIFEAEVMDTEVPEILPGPMQEPVEQASVPAVRSTSAVAKPEDVQGYHDGFTGEDVQIPRIVLMQALSDLVETGDAKPGEFINNVTLENYGTELEFILLAQSDREVIRGRARFVDKKLVCQSIDRITGTGDPGGHCPSCFFGQWHGDEPPECAEQFTYLTYAVDSDDDLPAAIVMGKTSMKNARSFNLLIKGMVNSIRKGKKPAFGTVYKLYSVKEKNQKGSYFVYKIKKSRPATEEEIQLTQELYDDFSGVSYQVEMNGDDAPTGAIIDDFVDANGDEPF